MVFAGLGVVQSRRNNDLAARFPEIVAVARALGDVVVDGELVALREGRLDFGVTGCDAACPGRIGVEVYFVAFDVLAVGDDYLRETPLVSRRARVEELFAGARPPLQLTPSTADRAVTDVWMRSEAVQVGIEGVVAKKAGSRYRVRWTGDWVKVRQKVVVDAVVVGVAGPLTARRRCCSPAPTATVCCC